MLLPRSVKTEAQMPLTPETEVKTGLVYFIQSGEFVKIGFCQRDPIRRLEKIQVGNPIKLKLLALIDGTRTDEGDWHSRYDKQRVRGEWFKLTPALRKAIKPHLVDHDEVSRNRPTRMIEGYPAHKLYGMLDEIAAAYDNPMESMVRLSNNAVPSRNAP